jgi:hypothetical protein
MPAMLECGDTSFDILHRWPTGPIETLWRACLADADFPTHYTAPEYFLEPAFCGKRPFAVLSLSGGVVTGVLTGIHDRDCLQSGLSVRPQIAVSHSADRSHAINSLVAGLVREGASAKLVDLFTWPDLATLIDPRFRQKPFEGVVMLDLTRGPEALFRKFSSNKKINIKKAIKLGVSVELAKSPDDVSAYYAVYVDWVRRKALPVIPQDEFQESFALMTNRRLFLARHDGQIIAGVVVRFLPGGVMEYAANSSLESALHLRPNDLLHWRAIEWACREGMTKYSLGGAHLFLRKFGGEVVPTMRHRLDLSILRRYAIGDWIAKKVEDVRPFLPERVVELGRSLRRQVERVRAQSGKRPEYLA